MFSITAVPQAILKFYITQALRNMKREIGIFTEAAQL